MENQINEILNKLNIWNDAYRNDEPMVSDETYDLLLDTLYNMDPDNPYFNKVGTSSNKRATFKLPIPMASMFKVKTLEELHRWVNKSIGGNDIEFIIMPKLDGISMGRNEINNKSFTRGDGKLGQDISNHYNMMGNKAIYDDLEYTNGEVMINRQLFLEKYSSEYSNPRNFVGGLLNSDIPSEYLKDCVYIRYGSNNFDTKKYLKKSDILDALNNKQVKKINYICSKLSDLNDEVFNSLFKEWSSEYDIDGLIIEVNDFSIQNRIGRDNRTNNPLFSIAYKSDNFETKVNTVVIGIEYNISKRGKLKPIINVEPVNIDGVIVSNITGNNARYIKNMGIGIGSEVRIKRSGMVIPQIVEVLTKKDFELPVINGVDIVWDVNEVDLETVGVSDEQSIKNAISFFEILECDNIGEGVIRQLWSNGFNSIEKIVKITEIDMINLPGFGIRKCEIILESIKKGLTNVELAKLQHASGLFNTLGYLKLKKLEHFKTKPNVSDVVLIDGFAELSANYYIESYDKYYEFISNIPHSIIQNTETKMSNNLEGIRVVFSGVRDAEFSKYIEQNGGTVSTGGVTSTTTHLIMKEIGSGSSKEVKAEKLGVNILTIDEFKKNLGFI